MRSLVWGPVRLKEWEVDRVSKMRRISRIRGFKDMKIIIDQLMPLWHSQFDHIEESQQIVSLNQ